MQSVRLNKDGKEIDPPSFSNSYDNYQSRYPGYSHYAHSRDMGIMGGCIDGSDEDEAWLKEKQAHTARMAGPSCSVLSDTTSLGKPLRLVDTPEFKRGNEIKNTPRLHDQDGLNQFLVQMNRFTKGDFITFANYPSCGNMVTWTTICYILSVDRKIEECVWHDKESAPKPFLLLDLTPMLPVADSNYFGGRYANLLFSRHLTADEIRQHIKNNVQLQNYIKQAEAATEAGSLTVKS